MADKRAFSLSVIDKDWFLELPLSTQALYFHLNMRADDDGFVDNPKSVLRKIGANNNDFDLLLAKRYVLAFASGVIVIKHWRMHNTIRGDRYKPTIFQEELNKLALKDNKSYTDNFIDFGNQTSEKDNISLNSINSNIYTSINNTNNNTILNTKEDTTNIYTSNNVLLESSGNQMATKWQPNGNQVATKKDVKEDKPYKEIVDYLNLKCNTKYRYNSQATKRLINARFNEDFTFEDFKVVIDNMSKEWKNDDKMKSYLRPETLFGTKFESYLNRKSNKGYAYSGEESDGAF